MYVRGQAQDFDYWSQLGNTGWAWDDVLPYFKRAETWKGDGKLDLDDFYDNVSDKKRKHKEISNDKLEKQLRDKAIASHKNQLKDRFFSGSADFPKHCIVHRTQNFYVMVTPWKPLVSGHLLIVPIEDGISSYRERVEIVKMVGIDNIKCGFWAKTERFSSKTAIFTENTFFSKHRFLAQIRNLFKRAFTSN